MAKVAKRRRPVSIRGNPTELNNKDMGEQDEARERALDDTLAETFPASDPLSTDPDPAPGDADKEKLAS